MNGWMWLAFVVILVISQHYHLLHTVDKITASTQQSIKIGCTQLIVKSKEKHYSQLFSQSWRFPAEVIFTEKAIYIFRYIGLLGYTKIFVQYHCLYAAETDIPPFLKSRIDHFRFIHQIDLLHIEGRNVTIEFGEYVSWTSAPFHEYQYVLLDVRDNDAYRNLLFFQRYRYNFLQDQRDF